MIAHIFDDLCNGCNSCVTICPTHVFDAGDSAPVITRPDQCQTCYMCELYCVSDAIYVGPDSHAAEIIDAETIRASGHLGRVRRDHGWRRVIWTIIGCSAHYCRKAAKPPLNAIARWRRRGSKRQAEILAFRTSDHRY